MSFIDNCGAGKPRHHHTNEYFIRLLNEISVCRNSKRKYALKKKFNEEIIEFKKSIPISGHSMLGIENNQAPLNNNWRFK